MKHSKLNPIPDVALTLGLLVASASAADQPNILYINADDYGVMDIGFNSDRYRTPNLDQLRAEGMLFTDAYAPAANCAPSRACVLSGQYGPRHGVYTVNSSARGNSKDRKLIPIENTLHLDPEIMTMADALKAGGYTTIHLGKWHAGDDPLEQGFDVNIGGDKTGSPAGGYHSPFKRGSMKQYNKLYPKGTHRVDIYADQAIQFMRANQNTPFFMHMAYYAVHTPLQAVPEFVDHYKGQKVHAVYASMVEKMDQGIGKILDEVEALGLAEKTLVVFCSDNGGVTDYANQAPYRAGKGSYFEGGIREPLIIRWPGKIAPDSTCEVPVCAIDFFPTFLEAAKLPVPENKILDGVSLMPLFEKNGAIAERTLFWHFPIYLQGYKNKGDFHDSVFRTRPGSALRQGKWKLHEYFEDGRLELYDLEADMGERTNLVESHPEKAAELHRMLKQWRAETDAPVPTELNPKYQVD